MTGPESETERAREALGIIEHEMQPIPGFPPSNVVALTMGEAEVIRAALRAALSAPATDPERGQGANEAWRFCSHCGAAQWEGGTDPNPNSITLPAVPVAPSEENEK